MELTTHQKEKMEEIVTLIKAGEKRITLTAKAGCGKTFMVNALIKVLKTTLYKYGAVYITAPTHKALSVLRGKIDAKPYIHFKTIHSAHGLKRQIDFKTGETKFVQTPENPNNPRFRAAQVVIVDESTMLEAAMIAYNDQHPHLLFIFVGDPTNKDEGHPGQLPPVNEAASPIFTQGYPDVHLTKIVRQGEGSPIIELSNNLRLIKSKIDKVNEVGSYIFDNNTDYIIDKLAEANGTDEIKYLAWTNDAVNKMNEAVRKKIYGNNPAKIEPGEGIVFSAPYHDFKNSQEVKIDKIKIKEDYILKVPTEKTKFHFIEDNLMLQEQFDPVTKEKLDTYLKIPLKVYLVQIQMSEEEKRELELEKLEEDEFDDEFNFEVPQPIEGEEVPEEEFYPDIVVLHEESEKIFQHYLLNLKANCKQGKIVWPAFYWFTEQFAEFKYNHAISVHKSQGSTYSTAIVNVGNIEMNRKSRPEETDSMLYTAVTRAAKIVVLYNVR